MQNEDFEFLANEGNLSNAFALCELLAEFKAECRNRFAAKLGRAMREYSAKAGNWTLHGEDGEYWLEPKSNAGVPAKVFPYVELEYAEDSENELFPSYGLSFFEASEKTERAATALANEQGLTKGSGYAYELVADFPRHNPYQSYLAIIGENGVNLADQMACKAVELALMLELRDAK